MCEGGDVDLLHRNVVSISSGANEHYFIVHSSARTDLEEAGCVRKRRNDRPIHRIRTQIRNLPAAMSPGMVHLNVYECQRTDDKLEVWRWPSPDNHTPDLIDENCDFITTDSRSTPAIAVPTNSEGLDVLENETNYEREEISWQEHLWIYSNLVRYSIIRHLVNRHDFEPLQVDQNKARTNRVYEVYETEPLSEPVDGLEIRAGLKVRVHSWDLPEQDPFVGVNFAYTTTNYFAAPLEEVLSEVDTADYWLKMKCPSDCAHTECTFHGKKGLVGKFGGFEDEGEACRYDSASSDQYVKLSSSAEGVASNPPAERVAIEPSYENIRQWAVDKHGSSKDRIVGEIDRKRLGIPKYMNDGEATDKRYLFEQHRLGELVEEIDKKVRLPLGQTVTIASHPVEIVA